MDYCLHILVLIAIYAIACISLDLLVGQTGLLSVGHAVFFGVGAYAAAIGMTRWGMSFPATVGLGMILTAPLSLLISLPAIRLRRDYFVLLTFAFQVVCFYVTNNWIGFTRGALGVSGVPGPSIWGWELTSKGAYLMSIGFTGVAVFVACSRIARSSFGRLLRAVREDETVVRAWGKSPARAKIEVCAFAAICASVAGAWYAVYISFVDPSTVDIGQSMLLLAMVIVGGTGSPRGAVLGAAVLVAVPEGLRFLGLPGGAAAHVREMLYGGLLVVMMFVRPQGFVGRYSLSTRS